MQIRAVLFDLDGTLTKPLLDFSRIRNEIGLGPDCPSVLEGIRQLEPECRDRAMEILCRHEEHAAIHSTLNPGAESLLAYLRQGSISTGILTRNSQKCTQFVLQKHRLSFDGIITREQGPVKPNGFGVLQLCRQFKVSPSDTLVVGDYLHDLQAARHAGAIPVLLMTHPQAKKFKQIAVFCISCLDEVRPIIDNFENLYEENKI